MMRLKWLRVRFRPVFSSLGCSPALPFPPWIGGSGSRRSLGATGSSATRGPILPGAAGLLAEGLCNRAESAPARWFGSGSFSGASRWAALASRASVCMANGLGARARRRQRRQAAAQRARSPAAAAEDPASGPRWDPAPGGSPDVDGRCGSASSSAPAPGRGVPEAPGVGAGLAPRRHVGRAPGRSPPKYQAPTPTIVF